MTTIRGAAGVAAQALLAGAGAMGGLACGGGGAGNGIAGDSVYVGVAASMAGGSNTAYFDGVRLAIDHLNQMRTRDRRPFAVRMPGGGAATQVEMAAAFRDDPTVVAVVGHTGSSQMMEAAPIYGDIAGGGRHALVAISPGATSPAIRGVSPWVFRDCPTDDDMAAAMAAFAVDSLHRRRAALIYRNDLFGRGFARAFTRAYVGKGGTIVERDPYLAGITSYEAYVKRMRTRGIEAVIVAGGAADAGPMLRAVRGELGEIPVVGTDDMASIQADTGAAVEFRGVRYAAFYRPQREPSAQGAQFASEYRRRFGAAPDTRAALAYDAATIIGHAVMEVGADRGKVRDWVSTVGRGRSAHQGITGEIRFDERGDAVGKPVFIAEVRP